MKSLPIVALIGQTNAGKSSLLNRFAHKNIAIVAREEGTTRDNVYARIGDEFLLVDTAGLKKPEDDFEASIREQIDDAIDAAAIICVVVDSTKYFDDHDRQIARSALRSKKPVYLLLNKSDRGESLDANEFRALGIPEDHIFRTSATTGLGIADLKQSLRESIEDSAVLRGLFEGGAERGSASISAARPWRRAGPTRPEKSVSQDSMGTSQLAPLKIALIGRPNVGKSSLFNSLGKKQQAIVSSRQGTTRDINRVEIKYKGKTIEILDTAGLRKPGKREVGIEKFSALRTLAAIEEADICALLIDSTEPHAKLDQALAGEIIKAGKGIILVLTKTDLLQAVRSSLGNKEISPPPKLSEAELGISSGNKGFLPANSQRQPISTTTNNYRRSDDRLAVVNLKTVQRTPLEEVSSSASQDEVSRPKNLLHLNMTSEVDRILDELEYDFNFIPFAPALITSSKTGKNVTRLFELALTVDEQRHHEMKTSELNKILRDAIVSHPPAGLKNTRPRPKYIVQTDTCPPWFVIHGHDLKLLHWSYKRFLERKIREVYPFIGTPIMFSFRSSDRDNPRDMVK